MNKSYPERTLLLINILISSFEVLQINVMNFAKPLEDKYNDIITFDVIILQVISPQLSRIDNGQFSCVF